MTDSAAEGVFGRLGGNCSTDGSFATGSDSGTTTKEEKEYSKVKNVTRGALTRIEMAGIMRMNLFVGRGDRKENPSDFLSDVEMAARSWDATYGADTDNPDAAKIAIFRQNLDREGDAWYWWSCVLADVEKLTFAGIKKAFLKRYGAEKNKAIYRFNIQNELMCLQQKRRQPIAEYVREAEVLSERVPTDMNDMLAMAFIRGLSDQESRRRMSYDLRDTPEFTFAKALHMVKAWYQEIGVPDPFNRFSTAHSSQPPAIANPIYAVPASGVVAAQGEVNNASGGGGQAKNPMQEAFNQMMLNFMGSMKADFQLTPHRTPGVISAIGGGAVGNAGAQRGGSAGGAPTGLICYNCQKPGHYASQCKSPSTRNTDNKGSKEGTSNSVHVAKTTGVGESDSNAGRNHNASRSMEAGQVNRVTEVLEDELSPVSCVIVVSVAADKSIVGAACSTLMRMPAVAAIFEKAMVDKRVRVEDDEYEQPTRGPKHPRIERPTTRSGGTAGPSNRPPPQVLTDSSPEPESSDDEEAIVLKPSIQEPGPMETPPQTQDPVQGSMPKGPAITKKGITVKSMYKPVPPINWMRGQKQYSLQDALDDVTPKISFPQLLDVSPRLRRELAELLRSSVPRVRRKGKGKTAQGSTENVGVVKHTPLIMTEAHEDGEVHCLYIDAWIGDQLINDVLVDGGAMLDLISQKVVRKLRLEKHLVKGLGMRLADDSLVRLDHYVWADVVVAGVIARIKAYVVPVSVTYKILLSRRWLKRVHGIEYHETNILQIEGMDRVRREVKGKPATKDEVELVRIQEPDEEVQEVENSEAEEAIEILLHELDHWDDGVEEEGLAGKA